MILSRYRAVLFDWDGTLVDTCGLVLAAHNHVRAHYGQALWTMDDFMGRASQSAREYYPQVYGDRAEEAQKILYDYVEENHLKALAPIEGAQKILDALHHMSCPMAVVSNKRHKTLQLEVDHLGWRHYFVTAIGAGYAAKDKPNPDPLLAAMAEINSTYQPQDILYVGDTETDLLTARHAGCDIAFLQSEKPRPDLVQSYSPAYFWENYESFLCLISAKVA